MASAENGYPFPDTIRDDTKIVRGKFSIPKIVPEYPNIVIKELSYGDPVDDSDAKIEEEKRGIIALTRALRETKTDLRGFIPEFQLVEGVNDKKEPRMFILQEKVTGRDFHTGDALSPEFEAQIDDLACACLDFYEETKCVDPNSGLVVGQLPDIARRRLSLADSRKNKEYFYTFRNIVIGKTKEDPRERVYAVDVYPTFAVSKMDVDPLKNMLGAIEQHEAFGNRGSDRSPFCPKAKMRLQKYLEEWASEFPPDSNSS